MSARTTCWACNRPIAIVLVLLSLAEEAANPSERPWRAPDRARCSGCPPLAAVHAQERVLDGSRGLAPPDPRGDWLVGGPPAELGLLRKRRPSISLVFTDEQVEAAVRALSDPERFTGAERALSVLAPQLQRVLAHALEEGGWFGDAHRSQVRSALAEADEVARAERIETLLAEETRMGMLAAWRLAGSSPGNSTCKTNLKETETWISDSWDACFELTEGDTRVLIDPFLTGNPKAAAEASELEPTHIFLTHGHGDHYGDIEAIAKRTGAQKVVAIVEIANELGEAGVENVSDPNMGGTVEFDDVWVRLVPAWHTSTTPKGTANVPAGMVIGLGGKVVYHLGDTALFSDLRLVGERDPVDVALMCIGGHYTMDRHDGVKAAELVWRWPR